MQSKAKLISQFSKIFSNDLMVLNYQDPAWQRARLAQGVKHAIERVLTSRRRLAEFTIYLVDLQPRDCYRTLYDD